MWVCPCVDRDTAFPALSEMRKKSSRNDFESYICVYGDSCRVTRHIQPENDEVVRGRVGRSVWFIVHKDLAGCVMQHKINTGPA